MSPSFLWEAEGVCSVGGVRAAMVAEASPQVQAVSRVAGWSRAWWLVHAASPHAVRLRASCLVIYWNQPDHPQPLPETVW